MTTVFYPAFPGPERSRAARGGRMRPPHLRLAALNIHRKDALVCGPRVNQVAAAAKAHSPAAGGVRLRVDGRACAGQWGCRARWLRQAQAARAGGWRRHQRAPHLDFMHLLCRLLAEPVQHQVAVNDARGHHPAARVYVHVLRQRGAQRCDLRAPAGSACMYLHGARCSTHHGLVRHFHCVQQHVLHGCRSASSTQVEHKETGGAAGRLPNGREPRQAGGGAQRGAGSICILWHSLRRSLPCLSGGKTL